MIDSFIQENAEVIEKMLSLIYNSEYTNFCFNVNDSSDKKMIVMFVTDKNEEEFEMATLFANQVLTKNSTFEDVKSDVIDLLKNELSEEAEVKEVEVVNEEEV